MKSCLSLAGILAALASPGAQASFQELDGIACRGGEMRVVPGAAFSASCAGDFLIGASGAIRAEESIRLSALGNAEIRGHLHAPYIVIIAGGAVHVGEGATLTVDGLGVDEAGWSLAGDAVLARAGTALGVGSRPAVDHVAVSPHASAVIAPNGTVFAVPEPATLLLAVAGGAAMIWPRRPRRARS